MLMKIEQQQEALETAQINAAVLTSMGMAQIALKNMNINLMDLTPANLMRTMMMMMMKTTMNLTETWN